MKITLAGTVLGRGGIQTHLDALAAMLIDHGHGVQIVALDREGDRHAVVQRFSGRPVEFCWAYHTESRRQVAARGFAAIASGLTRFRPDVYIACGTGWNLFLPALVSLPKTPKVFHEVMSGEAAGALDTRWAVRAGFDAVVAQARPVADNFARHFGWRGTIPVLPAFPQALERPVDRAEPRARRSGGLKAAFFGRLVPHKRAHWLATQWHELSAHLSELHIFGDGPELEPIGAWIDRERLDGKVFCHGAYPAGAEHARLLSTMDMTLLPTVGAEGAPLVLLESMACGVPFVATDAGGLRDYANEDCVVVPASEPAAFIAGVGDLASRLRAGSVSARRLRAFYDANFSNTAIARQWTQWLAGLAPAVGAM